MTSTPEKDRSGGGMAMAGYRPLPGVPDEMVDADGSVRPVWRAFVAALEGQDRAGIEARFDRADQYLRDAGVFYRIYGDTAARERDWPLSHIPVLIEEREWQGIVAGLTQRADLLERVVADIYGPGTLIRDGHLPPGLIAASSEYLRPMVGVRPAGGHFLHFCCFEIGRGPDGAWWVLGDRTQAPSGAGFALENRVATARAFTDTYADMHVHRLAGFFGEFRNTMQGLRQTMDGRVGILSPGPLNETYYEHAYIARYLGFMLLEGEDLTVVDGKVMVRTVAGLKPVEVLWRRMDANFTDPLELEQSSHIGTPGLVSALRHGGLTMINALGSGVLELRAMLAFMPALSRALMGEDLAMPSIATWWCGQPAERAHVMENLDRMMIGPALSTRLPFDDTRSTMLGATMREQARDAARSWISKEGEKLVGQEAVTLSTTPAYVNGQLAPRPMSLRVFAARTASDWQIMPGGFARIGSSPDPTAIAMQRGGSAADVWVVSDGPVEKPTLLPRDKTGITRLSAGSLPSRAADNLFWLGRYIERAEATLRILRAWHARLAEFDEPQAPLLAHVTDYLSALDIEADEAIPAGLLANVESALTSASHIRDRFSVDGWLALNDLTRTLREFRTRVQPGDDATRAATVLLRKLAGFAGLLHENMYRFTGWRFLVIGRGLERSLHMTRLLAHMTCDEAPDGAQDMVLEIADSVMTHRRRYSVATQPLTVLDLLALDRLNPRSILYQLDEIREQVELLPSALVHGQMSPLMRDVTRVHAGLAVQTPEGLTQEYLHGLTEDIWSLSNQISTTYMA
ncbi:hypothetical protein FDP22_14620 [Paroceanicella profunda]|uniref:Uncharacterized protein n=2 Tax=Paroceanicella profunda TaxID=2579971 RepID=A0A5B8G164_9RHOB|nr:hypothetical protein FDP22_14620 [Paroceanicella profunda]